MNYTQVVKATQWLKHGDHDKVSKEIPPYATILHSNVSMFGNLETPNGGYIVEPTDWIIERENGELEVMNDLKFKQTYKQTQ